MQCFIYCLYLITDSTFWLKRQKVSCGSYKSENFLLCSLYKFEAGTAGQITRCYDWLVTSEDALDSGWDYLLLGKLTFLHFISLSFTLCDAKVNEIDH